MMTNSEKYEGMPATAPGAPGMQGKPNPKIEQLHATALAAVAPLESLFKGSIAGSDNQDMAMKVAADRR